MVSSRDNDLPLDLEVSRAIEATEIVNSIIEWMGERVTIRHQISGGAKKAAVGSGETMKKRRFLMEVFTEIPFNSGKQITMMSIWERIDGVNEIRTVDMI